MDSITICQVRYSLFLFIRGSHIVEGFCHVVFRESRSVCELLKHCTRQQRSTIDYFLHIHMSPSSLTTTNISIRANRLKPVCIIVFFLFEYNNVK